MRTGRAEGATGPTYRVTANTMHRGRLIRVRVDVPADLYGVPFCVVRVRIRRRFEREARTWP